jgi:hypothetical protein
MAPELQFREGKACDERAHLNLTNVRLCVANFLAAYIWAVSADAQPTLYEILSNGQDSCGEFLMGDMSRQMIDVEWMLGFISGVNSRASAGDRMVGQSVRDIEAIPAWVQQYCRSHPLNYMPGAAEALRSELSKREDGRQY